MKRNSILASLLAVLVIIGWAGPGLTDWYESSDPGMTHNEEAIQADSGSAAAEGPVETGSVPNSEIVTPDRSGRPPLDADKYLGGGVDFRSGIDDGP